MSIPASAAAAAYLNATRSALGGTEGAKTPVEGAGDFSSVLKQALDSVAETSTRADKLALAQAAGKADIVDVVSAVAETEVTIRALVAVRDRVIGAYQEIMRMPI